MQTIDVDGPAEKLRGAWREAFGFLVEDGDGNLRIALDEVHVFGRLALAGDRPVLLLHSIPVVDVPDSPDLRAFLSGVGADAVRADVLPALDGDDRHVAVWGYQPVLMDLVTAEHVRALTGQMALHVRQVGQDVRDRFGGRASTVGISGFE